jgi:hypothetical protein
VVQENTLCLKIVMLRGTRELDWISVASIVLLFHLNLLPKRILDNEWVALGLNGSPEDAANNMLLTWRKRWVYVYDPSSNAQLDTLATNLYFFDLLDCKDPRDRLYALLGISADTDNLNIVPNYQISPQYLYLYASTRIYLMDRNLFLLRIISGSAVGNGTDNLPSWSYKGLPHVEDGIHSCDPHPAFSAQYGFRFEERNKVMIVHGRVIDKINFVSTESELAVGDLYSFCI